MKISSCMGIASMALVQGALAYTVDPPSTAPSDTIQDCTNWAVSTSSDTCDSLASDNGITNDQLTTYNPSLANGCSIIVGDSYCVEQNWGVPPETTSSSTTAKPSSTGNGITTPTPTQTGMVSSCNSFHKVVAGDTCYDIAAAAGVALADFYAWNPAVGSSCASLQTDTYVCVGIIGGSTATTTATTTTATTTTATNGVTTPSPTQSGMTSSCNKFHEVVSGDGCQAIADTNSISLADFYAWNPAVGDSCASLWSGYYVCVGIIGGTTTSKSVTSTTSTATTTTTGNGVTTPTPTQSGMAADCDGFYQVVSGDGCQAIADKYSISLANFYAWNPAVGDTCASLWAGYYYCVHKIGQATVTSTTTTKPTTTTTTTGNGVSTPTPTQTGMVSNCKTFHKVVSGDTCYDIAAAAGITLANFYAWNPAVGTSCSSLWAAYYVCIGTL